MRTFPMEVSTTKVAAHCRCDFIAVFYAVEAKFWKSLSPYTCLIHFCYTVRNIVLLRTFYEESRTKVAVSYPDDGRTAPSRGSAVS